MNIKLLISTLMITGAMSACNQAPDKINSATADSAVVASAVPADLKDENTQVVYNTYLKLKDALVASNSAGSQMAAQELATALAKIDGCENTASLASKISSSDNLADQRHNFTALSSDIVALMKHTDVNSGKLYVQYCPMANEGEGGYWLSADAEVRNPYYGDEMLNCGEVKETIGAL